MVLTGPPLHQEWAPSSNQASAGQSHTYRPRQQILCTRYHSRDTKNVHLPSISSQHSRGPAPTPTSSDSYLHPWGPEAQKTGLAKCLAKTDLAAGRARCLSWAKARRSAAVLLWRRVSACSEKETSGDFLPKPGS
ncbi:hypothetical protein J3E68DRAFT_413914 [Trichoderma sp. SZMC 28012]